MLIAGAKRALVGEFEILPCPLFSLVKSLGRFALSEAITKPFFCSKILSQFGHFIPSLILKCGKTEIMIKEGLALSLNHRADKVKENFQFLTSDFPASNFLCLQIFG